MVKRKEGGRMREKGWEERGRKAALLLVPFSGLSMNGQFL